MIKIFDFIKRYSIYILIILGFLIYFSTFFYDFVYDDFNLIINNKYLTCRTSINFFDFFIPSFVRDDIYIPFTFIIFWLVIKICGISSFALHFVNVVFYVLSSIVLYYLLKKIINNDSISFFAVILYIIHPCHIECTAWVSAMGYNIASLFFFLSFLFFILAFDESKKLYYICSVVFYILAILSQPIAVTLPVILFLWVYCCRKERLKESIIFIISYLPYLFIYLFLYHQTVLKTYRFDIAKISYLEKISILGFDILNSFFPITLSPIYSIPSSFYFIVLFLFIFIIYFFRNNKIFLFFLGFGIICILPYSNIFFTVAIPLADRYLLLFSISSCVFISIFSFWILKKIENIRLLKYISFIFFVILYVFSFFSYIQVFKNSNFFWSYAYRINPSYLVTYNYALNLMGNGKIVESLELCDKMIEKYSDYSVSKNYRYYELKIKCLINLNKIDEAISVLELCIKKNPEYYKWHFYLFNIYFNMANFDGLENVINDINKFDASKFLNNDEETFEQLKMIFYYLNADSDKFIESFSKITNGFYNFPNYFKDSIKLSDYDIMQESCLRYINEFPNSIQRKNVMILLNSLYVNKYYKKQAKTKIRYLVKQMTVANKFLFENDFLKAESLYIEIIDSDKYMFEAYFKLGEIYIKTNRLDKARNIYAKLLSITPSDTKIKTFLNSLDKNIKEK